MRLTSPPVTVTVALAAAGVAAVAGAPARADVAPPACAAWVPLYRDGAPAGARCADVATDHGRHTVLDLSPTWTPAALAAPPGEAAPAYRDTYLALAAGRLTDAPGEGLAAADRFLEIYGVVPTLEVIGARLADTARHRCHAAVDGGALATLATIPREETTAEATARKRATLALDRDLASQVKRRALADLDALAATSAHHRRQVARLRDGLAYLAAVGAAQAHLACEGLLAARHVDGRFTWRTAEALAAYQRQHALVPSERLDADTRATLAVAADELDFRTALRALRERVVAATGLIEDGSAGAGPAPVLGRALDPAHLGQARGHAPLPEAAPDLIGRATAAAALALGWSGPDATRRFLAGAIPPRVAVELPPRPAYHARHMVLEVEIDRGDVWYDERPRTRPVDRRPALTLFAVHPGGRVALVRWPTTIGGWNDEKLGSGEVVQRWKESPAGPVVWRDLYLAPTWLPPDTTPDRELVRYRDGRHELARESMGPSYRSAYGLVMLIHHQVVAGKGGLRFVDDGVRAHGSSRVGSLADGRSHGCHRLLPGAALRLAGFLLAHRAHVRHGEAATWYRRVVSYRGHFPVRITTRGHHVELTPPVPVEVLPGTIRSKRTTPPTRAVR
ncbi:MAG: peptidoglycan-binding protein [Myxococcales bacterium]|nr:peptidoglycan-binding protein [Myxococcales bacterium]